jgi:hypothetical protein
MDVHFMPDGSCFPNFMGNSSKGADKNGSPQHYSSDSKRTVKMVKAAFQGGEAVIELNDDALVEGLVASMPITLQFHDRGDGTKVGYFSADLFKGKQVEGIKPEAGDIVVNVRTGKLSCIAGKGSFRLIYCLWGGSSQVYKIWKLHREISKFISGRSKNRLSVVILLIKSGNKKDREGVVSRSFLLFIRIRISYS